MASDTILSNLFEIAQSEVDEILYFNDFVAEMRNNFKEFTNDEYDSALLAINEQIKSGNKLMSTSAGKVTISNSIISKAIKTVEYEKQQKENYEINSKENRISIEEVVVTTAVLSQMIANYDNLSQDEKYDLVSNLHMVDIAEMGNVLGKIENDYHNKAKNAKKEENKENYAFAEKLTGTFGKLYDEFNHGNTEKVKEILKEFPDFIKEIEALDNNSEEQNLINIDDLDINELREILEKGKLVIESIQKNLWNLSKLQEQEQLSQEDAKKLTNLQQWMKKLKSKYPKIYERILKESEGKKLEEDENVVVTQSEEPVNDIEKAPKKNETPREEVQKSTEFPKFEYNPEIFDKIVESNKKGIPSISFQEQDEESKTNQIEEIPIAPLKVGFKSKEIKEAVIQYKEYFERASEDDLQFLSEQTDAELAEILKSEFQELEVDEGVGKLLNVMAEINYHGKIGEMLTTPQKREKFFSELEQVANMDFEKFQDSVEVGEIKDSEVAELFKKLSVELQVAQFEPAIEEPAVAENSQSNVASSKSDQHAIQSTEFDGILIYNGVQMEVNEEFTKVAIEAQERGEDIQTAILDYYRTKEQEQAETERASEDKEEQAEPEIVVIDEKGEEAQEQETVMQEDVSRVADETGEQLQAGDGQHKNVVLIKKGKEGAIQVFRPSSFLKVVKQSEVTFDQVKDEQKELARIVEQERENGEKSSSSKGNGNKSNKSDSYSIDY